MNLKGEGQEGTGINNYFYNNIDFLDAAREISKESGKLARKICVAVVML